MRYFEHPCFEDAIGNVVWDQFQCGAMLPADSFIPLFALVAASYVAALERRRTGMTAPNTVSDDDFQELCRNIQAYILSLFANNFLAREEFNRHCEQMIALVISKWGERVAQIPHDTDF